MTKMLSLLKSTFYFEKEYFIYQSILKNNSLMRFTFNCEILIAESNELTSSSTKMANCKITWLAAIKS